MYVCILGVEQLTVASQRAVASMEEIVKPLSLVSLPQALSLPHSCPCGYNSNPFFAISHHRCPHLTLLKLGIAHHRVA